MGRFAKELSDWANQFKTATAVNQGDAARFGLEIERLGDQSLAEAYLALPLIHRASIYGEFLEREMVERFCEHNAFIPELVLADD